MSDAGINGQTLKTPERQKKVPSYYIAEDGGTGAPDKLKISNFLVRSQRERYLSSLVRNGIFAHALLP